MNVLVGSKNPVKIDSVTKAFSLYFKNISVLGVDVNSNVSAQPVNEKTFKGAKNRCLELINYAKQNNLDVDYFVGIEGGISLIHDVWFSYGCVCIANKEQNFGFGTSPMFMLPNNIIDRLLNGEELGLVMDDLFNHNNSKQSLGAIGILSNGVMNRTDLYYYGVITALIPFINNSLFNK